jgi:ATP-dependent exoDNAse (exonuclease V) beta subunit
VVLMFANGVAPRNIAAITFNELAAGQLFARIVEYLDALLSDQIPVELRMVFGVGVNPEQKTNLTAARRAIGELMATTIHGFCQQIIRPYPVEANLDPGARVMDEAEAQLAWEDRLKSLLRRRLDVDAGTDGLTTFVTVAGSEAEGQIGRLTEFLRRHRTADAAAIRYDPTLLSDFFNSVDTFTTWLSAQAYVEETTAALAAEIAGLAEVYRESLADEGNPRALMELALRPPVCCAHTQNLTWRKWGHKGKWQAAAAAAGRSKAEGGRVSDQGRVLYDAIGVAWVTLQGALGAAAFAELYGEFDELVQAYAEYKRDAALIDFDDLLLHARNLLRGNETVRKALAERYHQVLVDEFQDTDPVQAEILWRLCGEGSPDTPWQDRSLRPGALFCVGDPKQAIYRFRGADVDTYVRARDAIRAQHPENVLEVTANFRSLSPILEWVNQRFMTPLSADGQPGFQDLAATKQPRNDEPRVVALDVQVEGDKPKQKAIRDLEATAVARLCQRLIGSYRLEDRDVDRLVRAGDIALLAPAGTELWRYERALETVGIPVASQAGKGFFRRQEIQDLIAITRTLADSRDTVALGALLRGPLVGLTEEELLDIVATLPVGPADTDRLPRLTLWTEPADVRHELARAVFTILQDLARRAPATIPFELLAEAVEELRVRPILAQRHPWGAERALANVDLFLDMARPYQVRGLRAFAVAMRKKWEDSESQVEGRPDAEEQAVHLITMHSAKGLEWPIVMPVNTVTGPQGPSGLLRERLRDEVYYQLGPINHAAYDRVLTDEKAQSDRENIRLLYVACTRAEQLLILPRLSNGKSAWLEMAELLLDELPRLDLDRLDENVPARVLDQTNEQDQERFAAEAHRIVASTSTISWRQPSRHERPDEVVAAEQEKQQAFAEVDEARPLVQGGPVRGTVLHKLMEEVLTGETLGDADAVETRAVTLLEQLGVSAAEDAAQGIAPHELAQTVMNTLALPEIASLRDRLQPELAVWAHSQGDTPDVELATAGIADAVSLDEQGVIDVVVDWKSDVEPSNQQRQRYREQVRDYMGATGAKQGFVVYMTSGQVDQIGGD